MTRRPPRSTLFPSTTLSRSHILDQAVPPAVPVRPKKVLNIAVGLVVGLLLEIGRAHVYSSHSQISYAVFCLKKKNDRTCDRSHPRQPRPTAEHVRPPRTRHR